MRTMFSLIVAAIVFSTSAAAPAKSKPKAIKDCADCPELVRVPAGRFMMGITSAAQIAQGLPAHQAGTSEPVHEVTFAKPFLMGKYPVTVGQFRKFVDATGYQLSDSCYSQHVVDGHMIYESAKGFSWRGPSYPQDDRHPVVCVNWEDATAYAAWLSKKTGHSYSLPNDAQYEYAARGGTTTLFFWGDKRDATACLYSNQPDFAQSRAMGADAPAGPNYRFQCDDGFAYTSPVGSYRPNPFGLYDMQGNIWEYTADCWNPNYQGAPTDGSTWMTGDCDAHATRGGSYGNSVWTAYVAIRGPRDSDYNGHSFGFRIMRND